MTNFVALYEPSQRMFKGTTQTILPAVPWLTLDV